MAQSTSSRPEALRSFAKENSELIDLADIQTDNLKVSKDYSNPGSDLSFASLEQHINGVPVFQGEIKAAFSKRGDLVRVVNELAPGLDEGSVSPDFGDPA